jgi:hypothetical protein
VVRVWRLLDGAIEECISGLGLFGFMLLIDDEGSRKVSAKSDNLVLIEI